jgi:methylenetetrahydrofolate reductase (NADPH)
MVQNQLRSSFDRREFLCTAELVLGRDHTVGEAATFVREAAATPGGIRIVSVTDLPGGNPSLPPEAFVQEVTALGLTPIAHLTGKDGNRSFLEGRLHALARLEVPNVLALTGDAQKAAFLGTAKPVHDLDSVLLIRLVEALRAGLGYQAGSRSVATTPFDFFAGAVVNPFKTREADLMMQLYKMELKIAAGARFLITQVGFDVRRLFELRQYMLRENLGEVPVLANVYVPTATVARLMQSGELAGCVVNQTLVDRLARERKPERLERAALMVAAARDLGFAGAHIGGFGLAHRDVMTIVERATAIGGAWRGRVEELVFAHPGEFHLLPPGADGLSDGAGEYLAGRSRPRRSLQQGLSSLAHRLAIAPGSPGARFFEPRIRSRFWATLLRGSSFYRKAAFGCASCGDCIQDHLSYAGCSMRWCYKELRNGPCGGSRVDGTCEAHEGRPCRWNLVYAATLASGDDPRRFAHTLVPPRNWDLDDTNALVNRFADTDNLGNRQEIHVHHR